MDRFQLITIGIGLLFCVIGFSSVFHLNSECVAQGGQLVKGAIWYVCIK